MSDQSSSVAAEAYLPIRTLSSMTGVNATTLRAWERRYGLIQPQRTEKGHRLYTEEDVETIRKVLALVDQGIPISRVKNVLEGVEAGKESTSPIVAKALQGKAEQVAASASAGEGAGWSEYFDRLWQHIEQYDAFQLEQDYNQILARYPIDVVITKLLMPLSLKLQSSNDFDAETSFFSAFLRNKIGARFHQEMLHADEEQVLLWPLNESNCEVPLLLAGISLAQLKVRPLLFRNALDTEQSEAVVKKSGATGIFCCTDSPIPNRVYDFLREAVPVSEVPIFVYGGSNDLECERLKNVGAVALPTSLKESAKIVRDIVSM